MKAERTTSSYILIIGVLGLLLVGSLVIYQVYSAVIKSQVTSKQEKAIRPLDGSIEEEVVNELRGRRQFSLNELMKKLDFSMVVVDESEEGEEGETSSGEAVAGEGIEENSGEEATSAAELIESSQEASETGKVEEGNES